MVDQEPSAISRSGTLGGALAGGVAFAAGGSLNGCATRSEVRRRDTADPWRQFAGCTLNFASANTAPTSAIAARQLVTQAGIGWGRLCAIGTFVVVPMMLAGPAVRRWLVTGLTLGTVTGE